MLVCGSRGWKDAEAIEERLAELPPASTIMHGRALGADYLADRAARVLGHAVEQFPADWETHGRRAGIVRNLQMLDQRPELVLAFWDGSSPGTAHTIEEARRRGIPVEVILA